MLVDIEWRKIDQARETEKANKEYEIREKECKEAVKKMRDRYVDFLRNKKGKAYTAEEIIKACGSFSCPCHLGLGFYHSKNEYVRSHEEELILSIAGHHRSKNMDYFRHPNIVGYQLASDPCRFYWTE